VKLTRLGLVALPPLDSAYDAHGALEALHVKSISTRRIPLKRQELRNLTGAHVFKVKYRKTYEDQFAFSPPAGHCECGGDLGQPVPITSKVQCPTSMPTINANKMLFRRDCTTMIMFSRAPSTNGHV